jgi:L-aspartate oxidase
MGSHLKQTIHKLKELQSSLSQAHNRQQWEAHNILQTGLLIARLALAREESRGAHYRLDFPVHNDARFKKHSVICGEQIRFE